MKTIKLTQGKEAIVDDDLFEELSRYRWCLSSMGYAVRNSGHHNDGNKKTILMHRVIMRTQSGEEIDHINSDTLDNRRENLRLCTHIENLQNRNKQSNNAVGFKGVSWHSQGKKWRVQIRVNGKNISLGLFNNPEEAARAYDAGAKKYFGNFARTNFQGE